MKNKLLFSLFSIILVLSLFSVVSASWDISGCATYGVQDMTNNGTHLFILSNDANNGEVCMYDKDTHQLINSFTADGDLGGITTDGTYLYIVDDNSNNILVWNMDGTDTATTITSGTDGDGKIDYDGTYFWVAGNYFFVVEEVLIQGIYQLFSNGTMTGFYIPLQNYDLANGLTVDGTSIWVNLQDVYSVPQDMQKFDYAGNSIINYSIQKGALTNNQTHIWMANSTHIFLYDIDTMTELPDIPELPANTPPVITTTLSTVNVQVGSNWYYDYNATDEDLDVLTWSDDSALFVIDSSTGVINYTPTSAQIGTYEVIVTVDDGNSGIVTDTFTLNVLNTAPSITEKLVSISLIEGQSLVYDYNATDINLDTLTWSDNTTLFTISSSTGMITFNSADGQSGNYTILITVSDGTTTDTDVFNLEILNPVSGTRAPMTAEVVQEGPVITSETKDGIFKSVQVTLVGWWDDLLQWFRHLFTFI